MKLEKSGPAECTLPMRMNSTRWGAPVAMELRRLLLWAAWQVHPVTKKNKKKRQQQRTTWTIIIPRQNSFRILGLIRIDLIVNQETASQSFWFF